MNSSSASKQQNQSELVSIPLSEQIEHQTSSDDKLLIRERGVSLPAAMKIDYNDMTLRLSTSTPTDAPLHSTTQTDLLSSSLCDELFQEAMISNRASRPSLSTNEDDKQKLSSTPWLNTINTFTTTTEGPDGRK